MNWRKASYSSGNGGACVEAGNTQRGVAVRDSKDPEGPRLAIPAEGWKAFTRQVKRSLRRQYRRGTLQSEGAPRHCPGRHTPRVTRQPDRRATV
jgi:hypothetical protein